MNGGAKVGYMAVGIYVAVQVSVFGYPTNPLKFKTRKPVTSLYKLTTGPEKDSYT